MSPKYRSLGVFLLIVLAVSIIGGVATSGSVDTWYKTLQKPAFTPPDWLFAPVWSLLYIMIAIAGWRIWRQRHAHAITGAMSVYAAQLVLNLGWSLLFFGLQRPDLAGIGIILLLFTIALNIRLFFPIDRSAAYLLLPYLAWVGFASALNIAIWRLNSGSAL